MWWVLGISQITTNTSNLDSSNISENSRFSVSSGGEESYRQNQIIPSSSLRVFTFSELKVATRNSKPALQSGDGALYGVDINTGGIADSFANFVWDPSLVKINEINAATEAACLVLSVDETVKRVFTFFELKFATRNFKADKILGEGGSVYKGWHEEKGTNKIRFQIRQKPSLPLLFLCPNGTVAVEVHQNGESQRPESQRFEEPPSESFSALLVVAPCWFHSVSTRTTTADPLDASVLHSSTGDSLFYKVVVHLPLQKAQALDPGGDLFNEHIDTSAREQELRRGGYVSDMREGNSLKAPSSLQATGTNFATNFLSLGLAGFFLFEEALSFQWFAGALLIVIGVLVIGKSSTEGKKAPSE